MLTLAALAGSAVGIWLIGTPLLARRVVPFSGGVLVGISLFWVMPELAGRFGWFAGPGWLLVGLACLWLINRYVSPLCPTCAHGHEHDSCTRRLHGFAAPLIGAAAVHALIDGWGLAASLNEAAGSLGEAVFLGIALHKIPEGLAMGVILRAALGSWRTAMAGAAAAQAPMILGGFLESVTAPYVGSYWLFLLLALAGGSFLFLGVHALHTELKQRGALPTFATAVAGAAAAAALQHGFHTFFH